MTGRKTRTYLLKIDGELCKGCKLCIEFCPRNVLALSAEPNSMGSAYAQPLKMELCNGCQACTLVCPDACIELSEISGDGHA